VLTGREENTNCVCEGVPEFLASVCVLLIITVSEDLYVK